MFPTSNGLGQNIALAMRARERRAADQAAHPNDLQTILPDPNWDAFFEGLNETHDAADAAGMSFKVGMNNLGNLRPSLLALTKAQAMDAASQGYNVAGDDKHGYTRQFGPRRLGY